MKKRFQNKNVVVTGGAGFIGSHLADALIAEGARCIILDNLSTSDGSNVPKKATFIKLDIGKDPLDKILKNADYVFHLASIARTQESFENPIGCNESHVTGTLRLLEASRKAKKLKKFVYASSCAIYGPQKAMPIRETSPINHGTPYAFQKWVGEEYVRLFARLFGLPTVSLRYGNTYGTKRQSQSGGYPNVLAAFSKQKRESGTLSVTGDGTQTRDFIHVYDVVEATMRAALHDLHLGEALNISTGKGVSINMVARYFGVPIRYIAKRPGEAKHLVLDNTKARRVLGWKPHITLKEGLHIYFGA